MPTPGLREYARPAPPSWVAYHEAGHAVVSLEVRRAVVVVSIVPDDEALGRCRNSAPPSWFPARPCGEPRVRRFAERELMICLAGLYAEARFRGRWSLPGSRDDRAEVDRLLCHLAADAEAQNEALGHLAARTRELVGRPDVWRGIDYVARELLRCRELTGDAVRRLRARALLDARGQT